MTSITNPPITGRAAICKHYSIPVDHVRSHFEWAPGRKIDPSGPSMWAASGKWNMDEFREDVAASLTFPPPQELPMKYYALPPDTVGNRPHLVVWDGAVRYRANPDTDPLPEHRLPEEQYQNMLRCAGLA